MKLRLYGYDVEIRATDPEFHNEYNEQDTMLVLNSLAWDKWSLWSRYREDGKEGLAKLHEEDLRELAKALGKDFPLFKETKVDAGSRPRAEVVSDIKEWFLNHMNLFDKALEDLDDYNGYLGSDRIFSMCELCDHMEGLSAIDIIESVSAGFSTNDKFFKWYGTCYCSQNNKDYTKYVTEKTIDAMTSVKERLCIVDDKEIWKLFEELEGCEEVKG